MERFRSWLLPVIRHRRKRRSTNGSPNAARRCRVVVRKARVRAWRPAWQTLFTQQMVAGTQDPLVGGGANLTRTISVYRLRSSDWRSSYFLITNKIQTTPNPQPCKGSACVRVILSRSTRISAGPSLLEDGPGSTDAPTAAITIGNALQGSDTASGTYAISWTQPSVEMYNFTVPGAAIWQENFPNVFATAPPAPVLNAVQRVPLDAPVQLSFNSTNRFVSYSAAIFVRGADKNQFRDLPPTPLEVDVVSSAQWLSLSNPTAAMTDAFETKLKFNQPDFGAGASDSCDANGFITRNCQP